jgi:flavodoxin
MFERSQKPVMEVEIPDPRYRCSWAFSTWSGSHVGARFFPVGERQFGSMKALLIYDSTHGNTEKVAQAIGEAASVQVLRVSEVNPTDLKGLDLLIIGSPTHGGFPTEGIYRLLKAPLALHNVKVAVFDTRTRTTIFGYAAPKIAKSFEKNGANLLAPPEGFFVLGTKGPLVAGEIERAVGWAKDIAGQCQENQND